MDFNRDWTTFALRAEVEHFGTTRIAKAHNAMRAQIAAARREGVIEGLRMAVEAVATDDPKDAWAELSIRAELERLKAEG